MTRDCQERRPGQAGARKTPAAGVHVALATGSQAAPSQPPKQCKFTDMAGCTGSHPPWLCRAFGDKAPEESGKIIKNKRLCPFWLLHNVDKICFSNVNKTKPICEKDGCKRQHIKWLPEMLKEIPRAGSTWSRAGKAGGPVRIHG
jgi:hypothetical protein